MTSAILFLMIAPSFVIALCRRGKAAKRNEQSRVYPGARNVPVATGNADKGKTAPKTEPVGHTAKSVRFSSLSSIEGTEQGVR